MGLFSEGSLRIIATMVSLLGLLVITTFWSREPGKVEEKICAISVKSLPPRDGWKHRGVGRWPQTRPSCSLTNTLASRRLMDSDFIGPVNIGLKRW